MYSCRLDQGLTALSNSFFNSVYFAPFDFHPPAWLVVDIAVLCHSLIEAELLLLRHQFWPQKILARGHGLETATRYCPAILQGSRPVHLWKVGGIVCLLTSARPNVWLCSSRRASNSNVDSKMVESNSSSLKHSSQHPRSSIRPDRPRKPASTSTDATLTT